MRANPPSMVPLTRLSLSTPPLAGSGRMLDISPDGTRLAFIAEENGVRRLYLRSMDQLDARSVEGTEGARGGPFFSPDGEWVGFHVPVAERANRAGVLKKVPVSGGTVHTLCECDNPSFFGRLWGRDQRIYFDTWGGVSWIPATGGEPQVVTVAQEGERRGWADLLPDGNSLLITVKPRNTEWTDRSDIGIVSLESGDYRPLLEGAGHFARYVPTGHLVYAREGGLRAVPFDLGRLEVTGSPVSVLEGIVTNTVAGAAMFAFSENGTLAYIPGHRLFPPPMRLVWVDRDGEVEPIREVRAVYNPTLSPDGRRIALVNFQEANSDVWIYDIARGTLSRLTTSPGDEEHPVWSPDGRYLAFYSNRDPEKPANLYRKRTDGSGPAERLTESDERQIPRAWSPDGRVLAFNIRKDLRSSIWMLQMESERKPELFLETPTHVNSWPVDFSPDGRWLAYVSKETGRLEVYAVAYPDPGPRYRISTDGGWDPRWAADGSEIFYISENKLMAVPVSWNPELTVGKPQMLFQDQFYSYGGNVPSYDVTPDGQRFVMLQDVGVPAFTQINVVLNWFEELKRLVPTN